jgi:hypothetical protein
VRVTLLVSLAKTYSFRVTFFSSLGLLIGYEHHMKFPSRYSLGFDLLVLLVLLIYIILLTSNGSSQLFNVGLSFVIMPVTTRLQARLLTCSTKELSTAVSTGTRVFSTSSATNTRVLSKHNTTHQNSTNNSTMYALRCMLIVYIHPIPMGRGSVMGLWLCPVCCTHLK